MHSAPSWESNKLVFDVHGLPFNPQQIWRRPVSDAEAASIGLRGGQCPSCVAANISLPTAAAIGYCPLARIEFTRSKKFMPVRIFCPEDDSAPPPVDGSQPTVHWHAGAFDKLPYEWQHHVLNAAPHLGLALPLLNVVLGSGNASPAVTVVHTGMLDHPNVLADFPRPPRVQTVNLLDYRKSGRFSFEFRHFVLGFSVGGPHDWYTREAYVPFLTASRKLLPPPAAAAARPVVAWLSRASGPGSTRVLQDEANVATAVRRVLCTLGYELRIVRSGAPVGIHQFAQMRGAIGVHGGAFANVHACQPGSVVIEMQSHLPSSARWCYAALSTMLRLRYHAYFPSRFPSHYMSTDEDERRVVADPDDLASFVKEAFVAAAIADGHRLPPAETAGYCARQRVSAAELSPAVADDKPTVKGAAATTAAAARKPAAAAAAATAAAAAAAMRQARRPTAGQAQAKPWRRPPSTPLPGQQAHHAAMRRTNRGFMDGAQPLRDQLLAFQQLHRCAPPASVAAGVGATGTGQPASQAPLLVAEARAARCPLECDQGAEAHSCRACGGSNTEHPPIPNIVHYVWIGAGCPPRRATLSLATARLVLSPSAIYLWTLNGTSCDFDSAPGAAWRAFGAEQKAAPSWDELAQTIATGRTEVPGSVAPSPLFCKLRLSRHASVAHAHYSDLVRLHVLLTMGGLYLDGDGFLLRDLSRWRRCEFVMGRDLNDAASPRLSNGLMLGRPGATFARHWAANLSLGWDGSGWDAHSCSLPWTECARMPGMIAPTSRLRTVAPPKSWPSGAGAALARDATALRRFLHTEADGFHTSAFNGWAHEAPQTLWALLEGALHIAVRRAGGMRALDRAQAAHAQALLDGGLAGIYDGRAPLGGRSDESNGRASLRVSAPTASAPPRHPAVTQPPEPGAEPPTGPEGASTSYQSRRQTHSCNLPQAAPAITSRALVLSYLFGYSPSERSSMLTGFLGSLRASCDGCVAVVLHDGGLCEEVAKSYSARCVTRRLDAAPPPPPIRRRTLHKERAPGAPGSEARFTLFADYLSEVASEYSWVLLTDMRDVLFQRDPFSFLATPGVVRGIAPPGAPPDMSPGAASSSGRSDTSCMPTEQLLLFAEPTVLLHGDETMHANGCLACLPAAQCELAHMPLLNLGLLLGTPRASEGALRRLAATLAEHAAAPGCWDQSVFNALAYAHRGLADDESTRVVGVYADVGPYGTVGVGPSIRIDTSGAVVDQLGRPYLLVHQYDRYPQLASALAATTSSQREGAGRGTWARAPARVPALAGRTLEKPTPTLGRVRKVSRACGSIHRMSPALTATGCSTDEGILQARRSAAAALPIFSLEVQPAHGAAAPGPGRAATTMKGAPTAAMAAGHPSHSGGDCAIRPPLTVAPATSRRFPMAVYGCTGDQWNATSHIGCIDIVSRDILIHGRWEIDSPTEMAAGLPSIALPARGGTFLDVGANLGYFSLLFATHGWSVVSVEPMRQNRAALSASLCLNPALNVSLYPRALVSPAKRRSQCIARSFPRNQGNGVLTCGAHVQCPRPNADPSRRHPCEPVAVTTLDELLAESGVRAVDVVKIGELPSG